MTSATYRSERSAATTLEAVNAGPCIVWVNPNMGGAVSTSFPFAWDGKSLVNLFMGFRPNNLWKEWLLPRY